MTSPAPLHASTWSAQEQGRNYEQGRPDYPEAAIRVLSEQLGVGPGQLVVDVAAGTGKLTRGLRTTGAHVVAAEPMPGMRAALRAAVPGVDIIAATAERLPLRPAIVDAVTVAQAFHWFDVGAATAEIHRVLRPGGHLVVINNGRRNDVDWVAKISEILRRYERLAPRPERIHEWNDALRASPFFTNWQVVDVPHEQRFSSLEEFDARFTSVSSAILLSASDRADMVAELRQAARAVDPLVLPMYTTIQIGTRADAPAK